MTLFAPEDLPEIRNGGARWPILLWPEDVITMKRACVLVTKSEKILRAWYREFAVGRQSCKSGPIMFSAPGIVMIAHSDITALEHLRAGERAHPNVLRYLDYIADLRRQKRSPFESGL